MDAVFSPALVQPTTESSDRDSSFWIVLAASVAGVVGAVLMQSPQSADAIVQLASFGG